MKPYKAEIHWIDHATTTGWVSRREEILTSKMQSVCWVVRESKDQLVVTDTLCEAGNYRYPLAIARKLVTKIRKLK